MNTKIREWYTTIYADDELGEEIKDDITFADVLETLNNYEDVYEVIGVGDSIIRERIFEKLSILLNKGYDYIYNLWLSSNRINRITKNKCPKYVVTADGYIGVFQYFEFGEFPVYRFEGGDRIADNWELKHGSDNRKDLIHRAKSTNK
jgi:hypothetical protein